MILWIRWRNHLLTHHLIETLEAGVSDAETKRQQYYYRNCIELGDNFDMLLEASCLVYKAEEWLHCQFKLFVDLWLHSGAAGSISCWRVVSSEEWVSGGRVVTSERPRRIKRIVRCQPWASASRAVTQDSARVCTVNISCCSRRFRRRRRTADCPACSRCRSLPVINTDS